MAVSRCYSLLIALVLASPLLIDSATAHPPERSLQGGRGLVGITTRRDPESGLHLAIVLRLTPGFPVPLLVDLNGRYIWLNCENRRVSSTYTAPLCHSTQCSLAEGPDHPCLTCTTRAPGPGCHNGTCGVTVSNPITGQTSVGELAQETFGRVIRFLYVCTPPPNGLPSGAIGVAGLGHSHLSLPSQLAASLRLRAQFSLCLSGNDANGGVYTGIWPDGSPAVNVPALTQTPLRVGVSGEYFIDLNGIRINNKVVRVQVTSAILSTTVPFTVLEHSIYSAVTRFFVEQFRHAPRAAPVGPFGVCFRATGIARTPAGPVAPPIDLVLPNGLVWRITGANSLVEAGPGVLCLAFVNGGGSRPSRGGIVIGAYQMEDNLLQFDLVRSVLGFSSSLLLQGTRCSRLT